MKAILNILSIFGILLVLYQATVTIKREIIVRKLNENAIKKLKIGEMLIEATDLLDTKYWDVFGQEIYLNDIKFDSNNDSIIVYYVYPSGMLSKGLNVEFNPNNYKIISIQK